MNNASHNEKICTHCQQMKPLSDFVKNKRCADGYRYICKSCYNEKTREEAKRRTIKNSQESHHPNTKECSQCHKRKPLSEFPHDKTRRYGVRATCKTCTTQKRHIYLKLLERERLRQAHPPKEKKCSECHQVKPIQEFYKHTQNAI